MNVYKQQAIRGVQRNKNRINAFPKYLMETGNSALGKLDTSIYLRKMDPHEYSSDKNGEGGGLFDSYWPVIVVIDISVTKEHIKFLYTTICITLHKVQMK